MDRKLASPDKQHPSLTHALRMLDNAKMRVHSFGNPNIEVIRRDEAEAILRDALRPVVFASVVSPTVATGAMPRTDEIRRWAHGSDPLSVIDRLYEHARQLERELAEAIKDRDIATRSATCHSFRANEAEARLSASVRRLEQGDSYCPSCGHDRDHSATSTVVLYDGRRQCQMCNAIWTEFDGARADDTTSKT